MLSKYQNRFYIFFCISSIWLDIAQQISFSSNESQCLSTICNHLPSEEAKTLVIAARYYHVQQAAVVSRHLSVDGSLIFSPCFLSLFFCCRIRPKFVPRSNLCSRSVLGQKSKRAVGVNARAKDEGAVAVQTQRFALGNRPVLGDGGGVLAITIGIGSLLGVGVLRRWSRKGHILGSH